MTAKIPTKVLKRWEALEQMVDGLLPSLSEHPEKGRVLSTMLLLATYGHFGQYDKGGKPYILHPLKVLHYTKSDDEIIQAMAVGHDFVEDVYRHDRQRGLALLRKAGMPERVVAGVDALTKRDGESPEAYKARIMANPDAIVVKMADLRHNMDPRRLKGITDKDLERMSKYQIFYKELETEYHRRVAVAMMGGHPVGVEPPPVHTPAPSLA